MVCKRNQDKNIREFGGVCARPLRFNDREYWRRYWIFRNKISVCEFDLANYITLYRISSPPSIVKAVGGCGYGGQRSPIGVRISERTGVDGADILNLSDPIS
jgi:hypothetical protein